MTQYETEVLNANLEPVPQTPAACAGTTISTLMNCLIGGVVGVVLLGLLFTSVQNARSSTAENPRKCGVDWLLWVCGSDETFESCLQAKIKESQEQLEKELQRRPLFETQFGDISDNLIMPPEVELRYFKTRD
jgi:hypothetical protein